jgi:Ca2+-binding RTX toxin-like protein
MMAYALSGEKWAYSGSGAETVVTWSFAEAVIGSLSRFGGYPVFDSAISFSWRDLVRQAFAAWDDVSGLDFVEVADADSTDIRIGNDYIDGSGATLGVATSWFSGSSYLKAAIQMDGDSYASQDTFYSVVLHEIGHAFGLDHSPSAADIMYAYSDGKTSLSAGDIAGAVALYGRDPDIGSGVPGDGSEFLLGTSAADTIFGGLGADTISGLEGDDLIFGGQGVFADSISAGLGSDQVYAGDGNDTAAGGGGNDVLGGGQGSDILDGNDGNDVIYGGGGFFADFIAGGEGSDVIFAGAGDDRADGGGGADTVGGGAGADNLSGGTGDDIIYFGPNDGSADVYRAVASNGNDMIYGFENGRDRIDLTAFGGQQISFSSAEDGDAVITLAAGQTIRLDGVSFSDIDASDFV